MTNEQISNLKPLMASICFVLIFLLLMLYHYRQIAKSIAEAFKSGIVAMLIMLGIIDDNNE